MLEFIGKYRVFIIVGFVILTIIFSLLMNKYERTLFIDVSEEDFERIKAKSDETIGAITETFDITCGISDLYLEKEFDENDKDTYMCLSDDDFKRIRRTATKDVDIDKVKAIDENGNIINILNSIIENTKNLLEENRPHVDIEVMSIADKIMVSVSDVKNTLTHLADFTEENREEVLKENKADCSDAFKDVVHMQSVAKSYLAKFRVIKKKK